MKGVRRTQVNPAGRKLLKKILRQPDNVLIDEMLMELHVMTEELDWLNCEYEKARSVIVVLMERAESTKGEGEKCERERALS